MGDFTDTIPTFTAGERVRASKLQTIADLGTALSGAWTDWTPTLTNLDEGDGTVVAQYRRIGKTVDFILTVTLGSGATVGTGPTFTLPAEPSSIYGGTAPVGIVAILEATVGRWEGSAYALSGDVATIFYATETGNGSGTNITATAPFTWASGDIIAVYGRYQTT